MLSNINRLSLRGKQIQLPVFLPDATLGVVRSLDKTDLKNCGVKAVVVNTFHLLINPGVEKLKQFGGIAKFMNFDGLVVSDSGGFQIMSLLHQGKIKGKITPDGLKFTWRLKGENKTMLFSPELSIQTQFAINSDIMVALDYFTDPKANNSQQKFSVDLTLEWAKRSKQEFARQIKKRKLSDKNRPWLMGVVQGGTDLKLRKACAQALVKMDFDLYGYGGWPMDKKGKFDQKLFENNAKLTPDSKPRFALGVGKPEDIALGRKYGYQFFDCVLPTRDARHGRLYLALKNHKTSTLNIGQGKYAHSQKPLDAKCQCLTCQNYSRAYLHHLYRIKETLYYRLATIHNLYFYQSLLKRL